MLLDVLERQFAADAALELVGIAKEASEAISLAESLRPDIVMLDVDLGGSTSGFDVLRALRARNTVESGKCKVESEKAPSTSHFPLSTSREAASPSTSHVPLSTSTRGSAAAAPRVVMVSMFDNSMYRNRAFELGADAYATKGIRFATLRALLLDDRSYAVPEADRGKFWRNAPEVVAGEASSPLLTLSERERAVVREILSGAYEKEVAVRLGISVATVSTYLRRAMDKLGVSSRAELLRLRLTLYH